MTTDALALTAEQETAVEAILDWYGDPEAKRVFKLHGKAGTGKTTVLKEVVRRLREEHDEPRIHLAAFTNKAASVLRSKGLRDATTLHTNDLIWRYVRNRNGKGYHRPILKGEGAGIDALDLLIVDEVSMVGPELATRILYHPDPAYGKLFDDLSTGGGRREGLKVLAVGDPGQLWPVKSEEAAPWAKWDNFNVRLEQIHRSQEDSIILRAADAIYGPEERDWGKMWETIGLGSRPGIETLLRADQVIAYKNETRWHIINLLRQAKGMPAGEPDKGDRLVLLENSALGVKGDQFEVAWATRATMPASEKGGWPDFDYFTVGFSDGRSANVPARMFTGHDGEKAGIWDYRGAGVESMTFADAITCHKAQGSEWESVLVVDEGWMAQKSQGWHYTAITRARTHVGIVKAEHLPSEWTMDEARAIRDKWWCLVNENLIGAERATALAIIEAMGDGDAIRVSIDADVIAAKVGKSVSTVKNHMTKLRKAGWIKGKGKLTMLHFPEGIKRPGLVAQLHARMTRQALREVS